MKIGDLVKLKDYPKALIGLIVSIERRGVFHDRWQAKVQWFCSRNNVQYRCLSELEVVSESR